MDRFSSPVTSRQLGPHPRLTETVLRHTARPWRKPIADHSRAAFAELAPEVERWPGPLILDTGCGTGMSTGFLALRYPDSLVLGVDKSVVRLGRSGALPSNAKLVRFDLEDLWLLCREAGWKFARQFFLYPNPWPKPEQRMRRWPFHPVFPTALACGGLWELRTNWRIYADEFALAYQVVTGEASPVTSWNPALPLTLFEKKYQASGHDLWRWVSGPERTATRSPTQG